MSCWKVVDRGEFLCRAVGYILPPAGRRCRDTLLLFAGLYGEELAHPQPWACRGKSKCGLPTCLSAGRSVHLWVLVVTISFDLAGSDELLAP